MKRYEELNSIRGLAALIVLIYHVLMLHTLFFKNTYGDNDYWLINLIKYTPLRVFYSGEEAVILFFIISGFVLSVSYLNNTNNSYTIFLLKKIFRIYIPLIVSVGIAALIAITIPKGTIVEYETHTMLQSEINLELILQHLFLIGEFDSSALNPPIWFMVHYIRILFIFPFLMFHTLNKDWKQIILLALSLSVLGVIFDYFIPNVKASISYSKTVHYTSFFLIGRLLSQHIDLLVTTFKSMGKATRILAIIMSILALTYPWWFFYNAPFIHHYAINQWIVAFGASILIISSIAFTNISQLLLKEPFKFLGKISYSLFLVHMIVAFTTLRLIDDSVPYIIILVMIIFITLIASYIYNISVEKISVIIGKKVLNKIKNVNFFKKLKNLKNNEKV